MRDKNQWRVYNVYSGKFKYSKSESTNLVQHQVLDANDRRRASIMSRSFQLGVKSGLTILISVLMVYGIVQAGTITAPSGTPSAKFYSLTEIYNFINSNTTATEGGHSFTFSDDLAGGGYTLTQIYDVLAGLVSANKVKLGTTYLNTAGTLVPSGGDAEVGNVLADKTFFGNSQTDWTLQTGTMTNVGAQEITPSTSNQTITAGYHNGSGYCVGDANLISGNIKSGVTIFSIDGDGNVVDTSSGDAGAGDILFDKISWVGGSEITGSMTNVGAETITPSTSNQTITAGYHNGSGYCVGDTNLTAGNILADVDLFGVTGTVLKNIYNGSATSGATDYEFWTQALGGVDDYNGGAVQPMPTGSYEGDWTDCTSGADDWCGTSETDIADAKDNQTGLVWSVKIEGTDDTMSWFWANNCYEPDTEENPGTCTANDDDACQCIKKTSEKTGCEALGDGGWRLPYQKELMQAYINGSSKSSVSNLSSTGYYFWSSTTTSNNTHYAWYVYLTYGTTNGSVKPNVASYRSRCVR